MKVELIRERDGVVQSFDKEGATLLLRRQKASKAKAEGWVLNEEKLKFNGHDIIRKSSKKSNRKSKEQDST